LSNVSQSNLTPFWPSLSDHRPLRVELVPRQHVVAFPDLLDRLGPLRRQQRGARHEAGAQQRRIARAKTDWKKWGGRKAGTRVRVTVEKETLVRRLHAEHKPVAAIARLVGLSRKTVYQMLRRE
jgi:transcriptional regulator of acetoin/glycerol metabolism